MEKKEIDFERRKKEINKLVRDFHYSAFTQASRVSGIFCIKCLDPQTYTKLYGAFFTLYHGSSSDNFDRILHESACTIMKQLYRGNIAVTMHINGGATDITDRLENYSPDVLLIFLKARLKNRSFLLEVLELVV